MDPFWRKFGFVGLPVNLRRVLGWQIIVGDIVVIHVALVALLGSPEDQRMGYAADSRNFLSLVERTGMINAHEEKRNPGAIKGAPPIANARFTAIGTGMKTDLIKSKLPGRRNGIEQVLYIQRGRRRVGDGRR